MNFRPLKGFFFALLFAQIAQASENAAGDTPGGLQACGMKPYFECEAPKGWSVLRNPEFSSKRSKLYGLQLLGPKGPTGSHVRIEVDYFSPGNKVHKTPEKYIRVVARLDGGIGLPGEKSTQPEAVTFRGLPATRFTVKTFDFVKVSSTSDKKIGIQEEHLVIPAGKGFYVLEFRAPMGVINEFRPVFERFKDSFFMLAK